MKGLNLYMTITGVYDIQLYKEVIDEVMEKAPWLRRESLEGAVRKAANLVPPPDKYEETKAVLDEVGGFFDLPADAEAAYLKWVAENKPAETSSYKR